MPLKQPIMLKKQLWLLLIPILSMFAVVAVCIVNILRVEKIEIAENKKTQKKIKENKTAFLTMIIIEALCLLGMCIVALSSKDFCVNDPEAIVFFLTFETMSLAAFWIPVLIQYSGLNIGWNGFKDKKEEQGEHDDDDDA